MKGSIYLGLMKTNTAVDLQSPVRPLTENRWACIKRRAHLDKG